MTRILALTLGAVALLGLGVTAASFGGDAEHVSAHTIVPE